MDLPCDTSPPRQEDIFLSANHKQLYSNPTNQIQLYSNPTNQKLLHSYPTNQKLLYSTAHQSAAFPSPNRPIRNNFILAPTNQQPFIFLAANQKQLYSNAHHPGSRTSPFQPIRSNFILPPTNQQPFSFCTIRGNFILPPTNQQPSHFAQSEATLFYRPPISSLFFIFLTANQKQLYSNAHQSAAFLPSFQPIKGNFTLMPTNQQPFHIATHQPDLFNKSYSHSLDSSSFYLYSILCSQIKKFLFSISDQIVFSLK